MSNPAAEVFFAALDRANGPFDPCMICGSKPCECKPSACCGSPQSPSDFARANTLGCSWCGVGWDGSTVSGSHSSPT